MKNQLLILRESGNIHLYCINKDKIIKKMKHPDFIVLDICLPDIGFPIVETNHGFFKLFPKNNLMFQMCSAKNCNDYFSLTNNSTYKTNHVITEIYGDEIVKYLATNEIKNHSISDEIVLEKKRIYNDKLCSNFKLPGAIDKGGFGDVSKFVDKLTGDSFAIK